MKASKNTKYRLWLWGTNPKSYLTSEVARSVEEVITKMPWPGDKHNYHISTEKGNNGWWRVVLEQNTLHQMRTGKEIGPIFIYIHSGDITKAQKTFRRSTLYS
jgi:hypothetical protein